MNDNDAIDLKRLQQILRRQLPLMVFVTALFTGAAATYLLTTKKIYTAKTSILLDKSYSGAVSDISIIKKMAFDSTAVLSEVEVMKSHRVTDLVIKLLIERGYWNSEILNNSMKYAELVATITDNLKVVRAGDTYVLDIYYSEEDPKVASDIANAYATAYITDQLDTASETSTRTYNWLYKKTEEIRNQLNDAQEKVNKYRFEYNQQKEAERLGKPYSGEKRYTLTELAGYDKNAVSLSELLNAYIERTGQMQMQTSFPVTETRILTSATPPTTPSHPKNTLIMGASIVLGLGISFLLALLRDIFDKTLRRAGQVKRELDLPFLGFFPTSKNKHKKLVGLQNSKAEEVAIGLYMQSIEDQYSLSAETIRAVKYAIDQKLGSKPTKIIGVLSTSPSEGSSEISSNLALHSGFAGNETLLINGNFRRFTKIMTKSKTVGFEGLAAVLLNAKSIKDVALQNNLLNLSIIPSLSQESQQILHAIDTNKVKSLFTRSQNQFEYVFVDLPPLMANADLCFYNQSIDGYVLVSEWGKSLSNSVNFYLQQNQILKDKIVGVVLNRANMRQMKKFYGHAAYSR
ncbi:MAG: hypothetical protein IPH06_14000 [Alphaproteobacteria bacterium]|nr:hypothetical protein [Alphaproteobacteria bacterium]MBP6366725.1 hypothetical protein [Nitrosomonas sp.]